jgi:hypothetical protein
MMVVHFISGAVLKGKRIVEYQSEVEELKRASKYQTCLVNWTV